MEIESVEKQIADLKIRRDELQDDFDQFEIDSPIEHEPTANPYYHELEHVKEILEKWDK